MRIFIDCEWNDYQGPLISMALCAEDGREFYEVLECDDPKPWVAENVMPILEKDAIPLPEFRWKLQEFLRGFKRPHIVADWPEDIARFCEALITGPGTCLNVRPFMAEVCPIDAPSKRPHNALWDARAIREAYLAANAEARGRQSRPVKRTVRGQGGNT